MGAGEDAEARYFALYLREHGWLQSVVDALMTANERALDQLDYEPIGVKVLKITGMKDTDELRDDFLGWVHSQH